MGSYLDKPETTKKSEVDENDLLVIGSSSMQVGFCEKLKLGISANQFLCLFSGMAHKSRGN